MRIWVCVHLSTGDHGCWRLWITMDLEVVNLPIWVLGTNPGIIARMIGSPFSPENVIRYDFLCSVTTKSS